VVARHMTRRQRYSMCPGAAAVMIGISILAALTCCTATMAAAADDLYRAQAVVTGQREANRIIGFASCLEDVVIKVSGALKLAGDPRLAAYKSSAADFVGAYRYHDQMSGTPTRDEQGTALAKSGIDGAELTAVPSSTWASRAAEQGGELALVGRLVWDDQELGWATEWQRSGRAGRTDGSFAASRSTKPSGAPSAALRKSCRTTVIRGSRAARIAGRKAGQPKA
jgi:hypothetical protein